MSKFDLFRAWGRILTGGTPVLSIEITRECPLRCPGCYAYEPAHLAEAGPLRSLADSKGDELVERVMALVRKHRPIHVSIVGGEPLVRFRELDVLLPRLAAMNILVQVVTSAVRPIPLAWRDIPKLWISVSVDGLEEDHDRRRAPATYARILKNIEGHAITVHCTVTSQMARRPGSFEHFLEFWSARPEVARIWFSLFTPQVGATCEEILSPPVRAEVITKLEGLRPRFPKLKLPKAVAEGYRRPPTSPSDCLFARTTACVTADLETRIHPCQFGGNPDCSQCGCMASAGLKYIGDRRLLGLVPLHGLYEASNWVGQRWVQLAPHRPEVTRHPPAAVTQSRPVLDPDPS